MPVRYRLGEPSESKRRTMSAPRAYLILSLAAGAALPERLAATVTAGGIACVWLRLPPGLPDRERRPLVEAAAAAVQPAGAALLIDPPQDERMVARWGADGVHLPWTAEAGRAALAAHRPDRIVGAGALRTRDDAMAAGEAGADYVMLGEPRADGSLPDPEQTLERCRWWAEVFNTPCVGYAADPDSAAALAATGIEFVAAGDWLLADAGEPGDTAAAFRRRLDGA
jgi:thiamine-phosphate pyrophosphorylase